jgi:hypothetical protein
VNLSIRHSAQTTRGCGLLSGSRAHSQRRVLNLRCHRHLLRHIDLRAIRRILFSIDLEAFVAWVIPRISACCLRRVLLRYRTIPPLNFTSDPAKGGFNALEQRQRAAPKPNLPLGSARSSHHADGVCDNDTLPQVIGLSHHLPERFQSPVVPERFGFSATRNLIHGVTRKEVPSCRPYCVSGTLFTEMKVLENRRHIYRNRGHSVFSDDRAFWCPCPKCVEIHFSPIHTADCAQRLIVVGRGFRR